MFRKLSSPKKIYQEKNSSQMFLVFLFFPSLIAQWEIVVKSLFAGKLTCFNILSSILVLNLQ